MRGAVFHSVALKTIREFSGEVKKEFGKAIRDLQSGQSIGMPLSRPMPSVALGVSELRVRDASGVCRVFYLVKSVKGVLIFHAFVKKTQETPQREIELGKKRLKELLNEI